ncbi:FAD-dependent monooxygenase [Streptomyces sp. NPDC006514]|uniref:NAD(P)/FAD-dependent oxidoreductase n=1 Tax=Streptomyces sp. NPDC006514 TaxID=3154308 RepID=UPI0033B8E4D2
MSARRATHRDHALVFGAGIAGLMAAAVLADHFANVTLIDADHLPESPVRRPGVPQGDHIHGLLVGGQRTLEELLPGIGAELRQAGAVTVDMGADFLLGTSCGWGTRFPSDLTGVTASRALFEWAIRRRVLALPGLTLLQKHRVDGLTGGSGVVHAARIRSSEDEVLTHEADFFVDATGRGSRAGHWLTELGYPEVPQSTVDPHVTYASRTYLPPREAPDWLACYLMVTGPPQTGGGSIATIEGGRWIVTLNGLGPHGPTTDEAGFLPFAETLPHPVIAEALSSAQPLTPVITTHATANRRRHMERMPDQPANFVLLGDSACCFNPVYAQGMTAAVRSVALLRAFLPQHLEGKAPAARFHRQLAAMLDTYWLLATAVDLRHPTTQGDPPGGLQRLLAAGLDRLLAAGTRDHHAQQVFLEALNMLRGPASLLSPQLALRLLRAHTPRTPPTACHPPPAPRR